MDWPLLVLFGFANFACGFGLGAFTVWWSRPRYVPNPYYGIQQAKGPGSGQGSQHRHDATYATPKHETDR
jgi:hypothetical protein